MLIYIIKQKNYNNSKKLSNSVEGSRLQRVYFGYRQGQYSHSFCVMYIFIRQTAATTNKSKSKINADDR